MVVRSSFTGFAPLSLMIWSAMLMRGGLVLVLIVFETEWRNLLAYDAFDGVSEVII